MATLLKTDGTKVQVSPKNNMKSEITDEKIRDILLNSLVYPNCPKFWESKEFPISSKIGEGHKFKIKDEEYTTTADRNRNSGKRKIYAEITSYRGICAGAVHYYCHIYSYMHNTSKSGSSVSGYLGGYKMPQEFTGIDVELGRKVTTEMIAEEPARWESYHPGYMTNAFENKEDIYNLIDFLKVNVFTEDSWEWKIKGMV